MGDVCADEHRGDKSRTPTYLGEIYEVHRSLEADVSTPLWTPRGSAHYRRCGMPSTGKMYMEMLLLAVVLICGETLWRSCLGGKQ
jgi:hypothetical protein